MLPLLLPAVLMFFSSVSLARAQTPEYKVKVAYIYNFCRYVEWPEIAFEQEDTPLTIGVYGKDPFGKALQLLAKKKKIKGHPIVIKRFTDWNKYEPCHVLFVTGTATDEAKSRALTTTRGKPTLIVGESDGFAGAGATVNFFLDADGTVGFEINVDATKRQKLQVNAKLLKLARVVRDTK